MSNNALDYSASEKEIGKLLGIPARRVPWVYRRAMTKVGEGLIGAAVELGLDWSDPIDRRQIARAFWEVLTERANKNKNPCLPSTPALSNMSPKPRTFPRAGHARRERLHELSPRSPRKASPSTPS